MNRKYTSTISQTFASKILPRQKHLLILHFVHSMSYILASFTHKKAEIGAYQKNICCKYDQKSVMFFEFGQTVPKASVSHSL